MLGTSGYILSGDLVLYEGRPPRRIADRGQHGLGALGRPDLARDPRFATRPDRLRHDAALGGLLEAIFRTRPAGEWERLLIEANVAAARADEQSFEKFLEQAGLLIPLEHPDFGAFWRAPFAVDFSSAPNQVKAAAGIGEHTRPLLAELGYTPAEVDRLISEHVVGSPAPGALE